MEPNPKLKRGHVREDGMVFLRYHKIRSGDAVVWHEEWLTREAFDVERARLSEMSKAYQRRAFAENPERVLAARKAYYQANKAAQNERSRQWQRRNRAKCLAWIAAWRRRAIVKDPSIRLISNARSRIHIALTGNQKATNTFALMGVPDRHAFMSYVETLFQPGMTRANYGQWEVDHIIPCRYFRPWDLEAQKVCFHHSNMQPMWKRDNVRKRHRVSAACFDRVCSLCPPEHVSYLRALQQRLEAAGKLEKSPYSSPTHVPTS